MLIRLSALALSLTVALPALAQDAPSFITAMPPGVTVEAGSRADEARLRALDRTIRDEIEAGPGWHDMPVEIPASPVLDPSKYTVAARSGQYVGLLRVATVTRLRGMYA